jgi:hypothetical protein
VVIGTLSIGFFIAVVCTYACTEFLLAQLDRQRRKYDRGVRNLFIIAVANLMSLAIVWGFSLAMLMASGIDYYLEATLICVAAQFLWFAQHAWSYYRDHPRLANGERWRAPR